MRHPALVPDDCGRGDIGWRVVPSAGVSGIALGLSSGIHSVNDIDENPALGKYRRGNATDN
jgi:hypothetical protein